MNRNRSPAEGDLFFILLTISRQFYVQVIAKGLYIILKGPDPGRSYFANGLGIIVLELFDHIDISGLFKFIDLNTQVSRRGIGFFLKKNEFGLLHTDQQ